MSLPDELAHRTTGELRLYAVVDSAQPTTDVAELHAHVPQVATMSLFDGMPEQEVREGGPFLLPLNPFEPSHQPRLRWLAEAETRAPCLTWLWAAVTPGALFAHLQAQLITTLPDQGEALLRYYDPRVLHRLLTLFDASQRQQLAGPVQHWWLWHPEQGRIRHEFAQATA